MAAPFTSVTVPETVLLDGLPPLLLPLLLPLELPPPPPHPARQQAASSANRFGRPCRETVFRRAGCRVRLRVMMGISSSLKISGASHSAFHGERRLHFRVVTPGGGSV
jgi:hypothetical protein